MTLDDSIQGFRLRVLREAQRSGHVSATCRARCSIAGGPPAGALRAGRRASKAAYGPSGARARAQRDGGAAGDRGSLGMADAGPAVGERPTGRARARRGTRAICVHSTASTWGN